MSFLIFLLDLKDLIRKSAQAVDPIIRAFDAKLDLEFSDSISEVVGDHDQIRQVFINLLFWICLNIINKLVF